MDRAKIISELLGWIEKNLDNVEIRLSLDKVAKKSGYSKWHLQRMFKARTGVAVGAYIRARRLSKAAVALRLTSRPILDIALQYRFDSQQTFTRAFKKQFAVTPAFYRRTEDWSAYGICSPIRLGTYAQPKHEFTTMPRLELLGFSQSYTCSLEQISASRLEMRIQFWKQFLLNTPALPSVLFGLHEAQPSAEKEDEQELFYTTALLKEDSSLYLRHVPGMQSIEVPAGDYIKFTYKGAKAGFQDFVLTLYSTCMPALNLTRRKSPDVEIFYTQKPDYNPNEHDDIHCEYLIPVRVATE